VVDHPSGLCHYDDMTTNIKTYRSEATGELVMAVLGADGSYIADGQGTGLITPETMVNPGTPTSEVTTSLGAFLRIMIKVRQSFGG